VIDISFINTSMLKSIAYMYIKEYKLNLTFGDKLQRLVIDPRVS